MRRRIGLVGWFGSDNLGNELILQSPVTSLRDRDVKPFAVTIDAERTGRTMGSR